MGKAVYIWLVLSVLLACDTRLASAQDKQEAPKAKAEVAAQRRVRVRTTVVVLDPKDDMKDIISELRHQARERGAKASSARESSARERGANERSANERSARVRGEATNEVRSERRREAPSRNRSRRGGSPDRSGHR